MISSLLYLRRTWLLLLVILAVTSPIAPLAQQRESRVKQPTPSRSSTKTPRPLALKLEGSAQKYRGGLESARLGLELELREVLRQKNRRGMDPLEVTIGPIGDSEDRLRLALVAKNFIPESTGPWDKQDVLSFLASGDGPVYLNLSLLQSMIQPIAAYRNQVLGKLGETSPSIEAWSVTFERNGGQFLCFEGQFVSGKPIIHPALLIRGKKADASLAIKADGENVTEALLRGTFPLPPLKILGGQFSSTRSVLEFFGKE